LKIPPGPFIGENMAKNEKEKTTKLNSKEPAFIVKPALKNFGLDYMHIILIALVIILIALAFALSTFKQGTIITSCQNSTTNSICNSSSSTNSIHTSAQALNAAEHYLAAYSSVNTSLSLVPYYSLVNQSSASYLNNQKEWLVVIPYLDPLLHNEKFDISFILYDSNLTLANSFLQTLKPAGSSNNSVVSLGTVSLYNEIECRTAKPIPVYVITDPYAPGAIQTLFTAINESKAYTNSVNVSYFFIFSGYSQHYYSSFGTVQTQLAGRYLSCASNQKNFPQFLSNLSVAWTGTPLSNGTLYDVVLGSNLSITPFNNCMKNVTTRLDYESQFANLYNIVSTPYVIVNCKYSTLPESLPYAINYSLNNLNN
jgi:hypothetical protein